MMLEFTSNNENLSAFHGEILIVLISGIIISLLLFVLSLALINTNMRSRQIQQLNSQLEKLNADKDLFISILAHDLRSPFNAILGLSELLNDDIRKLDIDDIEDIAKTINKSARNSFNLLEDILMWARTQSGKIPFKPQKLSFAAIYKDVFEILYPNADTKNISINYTTDEDIFVFADIDMLKTILRNLVSNAIKFTNEGGTINISAVENSENTTISVSDNGIGINPDDLKKLFDISLVVSTKGTSDEKGTGFGLLLCKEFVDKHGGKIWAECEAGPGCDFKFTLPKFNEQTRFNK
jgi:signal transduction histidine kinase